MKKMIIGYGNPVDCLIMPESVDAVYIDNEDKKHLVYWLRGGHVQNIYFTDEKACREDLERVLLILTEK